MKINQVYIDLDGVLADLVLQTQRYLGQQPLLKAGECDLTKIFKISQNELMSLFSNYNFWEEMPAFHWSKLLVEYFESFGVFIYFVTHAVDSLNAFSGKYEWFRTHLSKYKNELIFIQAECRHLLAKEDRLLVDDSDQNVSDWILSGGQAILFPQQWNSNWNLRDQSLQYMMDRYEELSQ